MILISGNAHPALCQALAGQLAIPYASAEVTAFADGETRVHVDQDVRDASVFILQPTCPPVNDHLMVLALLADAVRAAGAAKVTALVPYFGYARQELRSRPGDPRSAQVASRLLGFVGIDHLVTFDLHAPALESVLPMPTTVLRAEDVFLPEIKSWKLTNLVVVAPDAGGMKRAQRYATALGWPMAVVIKQRPRADVATALQVLGDVHGQVCLIVDDMSSTGNTLASAGEALRRAGAREIRAVVTHPVMATGAETRLSEAQFAALLTSDSIPSTGTVWSQIVSIAPLLAQTVRYLTGQDHRSAQQSAGVTHLSYLDSTQQSARLDAVVEDLAGLKPFSRAGEVP